jgi:hypothetical protein
VSEDIGPQILLTTHSRHVIDAVGSSSGYFWVRNGAVDVAQAEDEIGVLIEIGALDIKERAGQPGTKAIVLTEDEITGPIEKLLESSGFDMKKTAVLSYFGVTGVKQLSPLVTIISSTNPNAKVILHRDLDFMNDEEAEKWKTEVRACNVDPFVTRGRDIESHFINAKYLAELNQDLTEIEFEELINSVILEMEPNTTADYVNARIDMARKEKKSGNLNAGKIAVEAPRVISTDVRRYCGKPVLKAIRQKYQSRCKKNMVSLEASEILSVPFLSNIAKRVFKTGV